MKKRFRIIFQFTDVAEWSCWTHLLRDLDTNDHFYYHKIDGWLLVNPEPWEAHGGIPFSELP